MKSGILNRIFLVGLLGVGVVDLGAFDEQELIRLLELRTGAPQTYAACQTLSVLGTADAVAVLAELLVDERLSQAARHALETLPYPEAGAALRHALDQTTGLVKTGLIDSLGRRAEPASVPVLTPLLSDSDKETAAAAAAALGQIGGGDAVTALLDTLDHPSAIVQDSVRESLLRCAELLAGGGDNATAAAIQRRLLDGPSPAHIRAGAWRGLAESDPEGRPDLVLTALSGSDRAVHVAALSWLRETDDAELIRMCVSRWAGLPTVSQLAVLDAHVALGVEALPTARRAVQSPDPALRVAGWQALGELSDVSSVADLTRAAAVGGSAERLAARTSLGRLRGPDVRQALLEHLEKASPGEQAELLRVFAERGDRETATVLLAYAVSDVDPVRVAALDSLRQLAPPETLVPLLELAAGSTSDTGREMILRALYAVCDGILDKELATRKILQTMQRIAPDQRRHLLPLLSELATADAFGAAVAASRDPDLELAVEAVRGLARWPTAAPAQHLLELARTGSATTLRILALRGAIAVAGHEPETGKRLALLHEALAVGERPEEKRQVMGQIAQIPTADALTIALEHLVNPDLIDEASLAAVAIAERLAPADPELARKAATRVLEQARHPEATRRAWALRAQPVTDVPFIRSWVLAGPYSRPDVQGAVALFDVPFAPEKPGQPVEWKPVPVADHVDLARLFPGTENAAAYLRTRIVALQETRGVLLMGSDDGIKVWLNGEVIHRNNVDRGMVVDEDATPIRLRKGSNDLLLKITQGGGGWAACARIVGLDGRPIPGLRTEQPSVLP